MAIYKIKYEGFAYVEADSLEDAKEYYEDDFIYDEHRITDAYEVDEAAVYI